MSPGRRESCGTLCNGISAGRGSDSELCQRSAQIGKRRWLREHLIDVRRQIVVRAQAMPHAGKQHNRCRRRDRLDCGCNTPAVANVACRDSRSSGSSSMTDDRLREIAADRRLATPTEQRLGLRAPPGDDACFVHARTISSEPGKTRHVSAYAARPTRPRALAAEIAHTEVEKLYLETMRE